MMRTLHCIDWEWAGQLLRSLLLVIVPMVIVLFSLILVAPAQEEKIDELLLDEGVEPRKEKKISFVAMPFPVSNPTIGSGGGVSLMPMYKLDESSPTSNLLLGGIYTDSDTWYAGVIKKTYLKEDRYRANAIAGVFNINMDFFGIGNEAGDRGISIPITQKGVGVRPEFLRRFHKNFYAGLSYALVKLETDLSGVVEEVREKFEGLGKLDMELDLPKIPELELETWVSGPGLRFMYDTRDNPLNPSQGTFLDFSSIFVDEAFGSTFNFQQYKIALNQYIGLGEGKVLALRLSACHAADRPPFFAFCLYGSSSDLRGYSTGQYRDRTMLAGQFEFRWQFYWRLGMVAFGGVGEVAPSLGEFTTEDILPSGGVGIRLMASKENRLNIGVDYAVGDASDGIYFRIGEAF